MKPTATFPSSIWDGSNTGRPNYNADHQDCDQEDYDRIAEEIRAVQNYLTTYVPVVFEIVLTAVAGNFDFVMPYACKVIDVMAMKHTGDGTPADYIEIFKGVPRMVYLSLDVDAEMIARITGLVDDAGLNTFAAGDILRITTSTDNCVARVYVTCLKV